MSNMDPQNVDYRKVSAGQGWQWYVEGWRLFLTRPGTLYLVLILFLLVQLAITIVPLVGSIVATLIAPAMIGGVYLVLDRIRQIRSDMRVDALAREQSISAGLLFEGLKHPSRRKPFLVLGVLSLLFNLLLASVLISAISMPMDPEAIENQEQLVQALMAAPMGIWLLLIGLWAAYMMAMTFAIPLVALREASATEAIKASIGAILGNIMPFLLYGLIGFGLMMVAMIPMGLGFIILIPVLFASVFSAFIDLFPPAIGAAGEMDGGERVRDGSELERSESTPSDSPRGPGRIEM